jgi:hypothetical protein
MVTEAILCRKVVIGLICCNYTLDNGVNLVVVGICEEYRLDVGFLVADVNHSILLLVGAGKFVLLNGSRKIVFKVAAHSNTILCAARHSLCVDVIMLLAILYKPATLFPRLEVLHRLCIYLIRVFVGYRRKIYLGFAYVQK